MNKSKLEMPISYQALKPIPQEDRRGHFCSPSASLVWHFIQGLLCLLLAHTSSSCSCPSQDTTQALHSLCQGRWWKPLPSVSSPWQRYLVLEFPILKKPQLILPFQIVSINMAEVYLKTERAHSDHGVLPHWQQPACAKLGP